MKCFRHRRDRISGKPCCPRNCWPRRGVAPAGARHQPSRQHCRPDRRARRRRSARSRVAEARAWRAASSCSTLPPTTGCGRVNGQELYDSNVEGTRNVLSAARDSGVRRVIYTSSVATMGFGNNGRLTDENTPVTLSNMIGDYKRSKFMAEQLVIEAARGGQNVVMVNPTTPIGERDIKPTPTGQNRGGFPEAQVSGLCRYRLEPGRCASIAPRDICWRWKKPGRASATFWAART